MPIRILNDEQGKTFSPCLLCDKVLEEVSPGSIQKHVNHMLVVKYNSSSATDRRSSTTTWV